jgi:hypothetical protein
MVMFAFHKMQFPFGGRSTLTRPHPRREPKRTRAMRVSKEPNAAASRSIVSTIDEAGNGILDFGLLCELADAVQ